MRKPILLACAVASLGHGLQADSLAQATGALAPTLGAVEAEKADPAGDPEAALWADLVAEETDKQEVARGDGSELSELSLEDLMGLDVKVTSVSRKAESRQGTAAAVHVITADQIRRSGIRSIPDALRMAPGIRVTRLSTGRYSVTARGFAWEFADKILVLVDGRSVYSPLFSGTEWENLDLPIEEVERIEVIRGPGGTMWGSNAVNGVINIITKSAKDEQGESLTLVYGDEERTDVLLRGGIRLGDRGFLRAFARSNERDSSSPNQTGIADGFEQSRFGLRSDFELGLGEQLMVTAGAFDAQTPRGRRVPSTAAPFAINRSSGQESTGGSLLSRWTKEHDSGSLSTLQASVAYLDTDSTQVIQDRTQLDLFYQRESSLGESQTIVWGLSFRYTDVRFDDTDIIQWDSDRHDKYYSGFLQDQIQIGEKTTVTAGVKLEDNPFTGLEIQPSLRAAYTVNANTTVWSSISRAIQTPSEVYRGARVFYQFIPDQGSGFDTSIVLNPDEGDTPESVLSLEAGLRTKLGERGSLDVSAFLNDYDDVRGAVLGTPSPTGPSNLEQPLFFQGVGQFRTFGVELASTYALRPDLVLRGTYTYTHVQESYDDPDGVIPWTFDSSTPKHLAYLGLSYDVAENWEFDTNAYFVSRTATRGEVIDPSVRLDVRVGWQPSDGVTVTVAGHGLIHDGQQEITGDNNTTDAYGADAGAYLGLRFEF